MKDKQNSKRRNSTGASRDLEIKVDLFCPSFSSCFHRVENFLDTNRPEEDSPNPKNPASLTEVLEFSRINSEAKAQEIDMTGANTNPFSKRKPKKRKRFQVSREQSELLKRYDIKAENFRQTVIRTFKKCIRTLFKNSTKNPITEEEIEELYLIDHCDHERTRESFNSILNCSQDLEFDIDEFNAKISQNSCNNGYVEQFFSKAVNRHLYNLHHEMAIRGRLYFESFKQLRQGCVSLTHHEREEIFSYCRNFYKSLD